MADDFGLGDLTDDQLIELARAVAMEFTLRDRSAYDAARAATQQAKASVRRATPGIDPIYDWSIARRAAMMIAETLGEKWSFAVWQSSTGERRVYLDAEGRKVSAVRATHRPYQQSRDGKVTFYVSGNGHAAPGKLEMANIPNSIRRDRLEAIVQYLEGAWDKWPGTKVSVALATEIPPAPLPPYYP